MSRNRTQDPMERASRQIRATRLPEGEARQIADRVWDRVSEAVDRDGERSIEAAETGTIRGCADYQALIPAFLAQRLAPSRALLLEEHTRHCVPCRKALKLARNGAEPSPAAAGSSAGRGRRNGVRWAAAAAVLVSALGIGYLMLGGAPDLPYGAVVESAGGGVYRVDTLAAVAEGERIAAGERVRTAPGESSILRLADGSRVEVKGRSELSVQGARRGTTVRMERGDVIVEAAPQRSGRLYVSTDDCLVSVKGTIFAVSHGTRGSRVAVIEGEVEVDYAGRERQLTAGDRAATWAGYGSTAVADFDYDLTWSRSVDEYLALLEEVTQLRQALQRELPRPGLRYASRLLGLAPDDTAFYAAVPNLVETLAEADRIVQERIAQSPMLSEWWSAQQGSDQVQGHLGLVSETLSEAADLLGKELVVTASVGALEGSPEMLFLAELVDAEGLRAFLAEQIAAHGGGPEEGIVFLDPAEPAGGAEGEQLVVWIGQQTLLASPQASRVRAAIERLQGGEPALTGFRARLAGVYEQGVEILVAADLQQLTQGRIEEGMEREQAERFGLLDASYLILQQKRVGDRTHSDAELVFDGPRRGPVSWLAEAAPMGSLSYISPDAKLAGAAILRRPVEMFDELMAMAAADPEADPAAGLAEARERLGFDPRDDLMAALGGEVAVALDGPVVPEPAWKAIVEVYDPGKLIYSLERMVAAINDQRREQGLEPFAWTSEEVGGRTYYAFQAERTLAVTLDEGYLLVAPNRAILDRAIRFRQSGYTLESSTRFARLLPPDGRGDFSALLYQNAMELLAPLAGQLQEMELTDEQRAALDALQGQQEPTLAYAYGEESRIVFAARGAFDLLTSGLPGMIGLGAGFGPELVPDLAGDPDGGEG